MALMHFYDEEEMDGILFVSSEMAYEIQEWAREHINGNHKLIAKYDANSNPILRFSFSREDDALLFKATWR